MSQMLDIRAVLIRGAGSAGLVYVAGTGVSFALHVLLSRLMGAEHYGVYVYVLSWITVLALIGKMGLDITLLRYVAAYTAREEWSALAGVLRRSFSLALGGTIGLSAAGALVVWVLRERLSAELAWTFWAGFGLLSVLALAHLRQSALRALRRVAQALLPELLVRPVILGVLMVGGVYGLGLPARGHVTMTLDLVASTVAFLLGSAWLYRALPAKVKAEQPSYRTREWVAVALPLFLLSGMRVIHSQTDILMIGSLLGTREAGIYAAASRIATLVLFGLVAVNAIAAPMMAGLYATGRGEELQRMVSLAARGILAVSLPIALGLLILGDWLLSLFGPAFPAAYTALVILVAGQLFNALAGSVGFLMTMTGHERQAAAIMAGSVAMNLALNAVLIPRFGIEGAAIATASTTVLWNALMFLFVHRQLRINSTAFRLSWQKRE